MRNLIADLIAIGGFTLLSYGIYLKYDLASSLIVSGSLLLIAGLFSQIRSR